MTKDNIVEFKFKDMFKSVTDELVKGEIVSYVGQDKDLSKLTDKLILEKTETNEKVALITSKKELKNLNNTEEIKDKFKIYSTSEFGLKPNTLEDIKERDYDVLIINCFEMLSEKDKDILLKGPNIFDTIILEPIKKDASMSNLDLLTFDIKNYENDSLEKLILVDTELVELSNSVEYVQEVVSLDYMKLK